MPETLVCPQGHRWQHPRGHGAADASTLVVCPVCGSPATDAAGPAAGTADQWETIAPSGRPAPPGSAPPPPDTVNPNAADTGMGPVPSGAAELTTATIVAGYEILAVLGRGAMGVVYKARQLSLNRPVALKMVLGGSHAGPQERARFLAEAEAVAGLQHPNIVQVYEVGSHDGLPFFSMEVVDGGSLERRARGTPLPPRDAAALVEKLARAMHYAHQRGVVHRDLKPANILLTADGEPKVTDFGLAKRMQDDPNATEARYATQSGAAVGTPSYMAPEQAAGKGKLVGPLADVYSLGAVLYDLLTGRPPFVAGSVVDTLVQVATAEPPSPASLQPRLPRDLVTICLKCLRKEPEKRFGTAGELADDLRRFLAGEPIRAVPVGRWERVVKWVRRRPAAAALVGVSAVAALALLGGGIAYQVKLNRALADARAERQVAVARLVRMSVQSGMDLVDHGRLPLSLPLLVEALRVSTEINQDASLPKEAVVADERMQRVRLAMVLRECPRLLRTWSHDGQVSDAAYSPDGKRVVTAGTDDVARVWDVASWEPVGPPLRHDGDVNAACFSPDGTRVLTASADGTARVWEVGSGREVCRSPRHPNGVAAAAFSPDGGRFCTAGEDGTARVCDAATGRELVPPLKHPAAVRDAAFSPNGRLVLTVAGEAARLWDADSGTPAGPHPELRHDGKQVLTAAFDKSSTRVVTGGDDNARLWDVATGCQLGPPLRHRPNRDQVTLFACFSPDGTLVATACNDGTARVWGADGAPATRLLQHQDAVNHLAFSPDGRHLATGSDDDTAVVWDIADGTPFCHALASNGDIGVVRFSPDGRHVLTASQSGVARLWKPVPAFRDPTPVAYRPAPFEKATSGDGNWEVVALDRFTLQIRNARTGAPEGPAFQPGGVVIGVVFNPDGSRLLTLGGDGHAQLWDRATGRRTPDVALEHGGPVLCGAFNAGGTLVATGGSDNTCRVWNAATGEPVTPAMRHGARVVRVVFCPDCRSLLTSSPDGSGRLWCSATGELLSPPLDLEGWVKQAFASPRDRAAWKLAVEGRPIEELAVEARWLSGHGIDRKTGGLVPNSGEEMKALRDDVRARYPHLVTFSP